MKGQGHLVRRGEHSWRFKYDVPGNGQRETRYVTLRGTRRQARAEAAKIMASLATGLHVDPSTETVAAFVERWLRDWAVANVGNQTYEGYAQMLPKHLSSRVGKMVKAGLPVQPDGRVDADEAIHWVACHVRSWRGGWETDENGRRRRIPID